MHLPPYTFHKKAVPPRRRQLLVADLTPDVSGTNPGVNLEFFLYERSCSNTRASSAGAPARDLQSLLSIRRE
jgi:hypothetical protein